MSCNNIIADSDIKMIYESTQHVDEVSIVSSCENDDKKITNINLVKDAVTMNRQTVEREYLRNARLRNNENQGKVVVNKLLALKDAYRGKNITKKFHEKEVEIYKNNDFKEIQLDAAWNGITHWPELGFEFYNLDSYHQQLYTLWSSFFIKSFTLPQEKKLDILMKYTNYVLIPKKYKKGFGQWLLDNNKNLAFPMYKVIE